MRTPLKRGTGSGFGLAGFEYFTYADYLRLFWRRRWLVVFTTLTFALVTAIVVHLLPSVYRATTVILVDPRKVPDNYVMSTVTSGVADRLATLRQQILSTTRLGQIIEEMGLYGELKGKKTQEEIIETMRKAVEVEVAATTSGDRGLGAFTISYHARNPVQAAQVTNRLASLFIEENVKAREQQVLGTAEFIERELDAARKDLAAKEEQIRQLKSRYVSGLPESQTFHVQALTSLQLELRSEIDAAGRAQQQKMYLQSLLAQDYPVVNLDQWASPELIALQTQFSQSSTELDELRKRYGPIHPDVQKKLSEVRSIQDHMDQIRKSEASAKRDTPPMRSRNPVVESQIASLEEEIQKHNARQQEIKKQIVYHQSKLEQIPILEQQMASVTRDYEAARDNYRHLLGRKFSADMSSNLETYQKGERFIVLDPAQVPERPFRPDRVLINLLGLVAGFGLALALVPLLEILDTTVKTHQEVTELLQADVIAAIPWLPTPWQRRRRWLRTTFAATSSTVLFVAYVALFAMSWH